MVSWSWSLKCQLSIISKYMYPFFRLGIVYWTVTFFNQFFKLCCLCFCPLTFMYIFLYGLIQCTCKLLNWSQLGTCSSFLRLNSKTNRTLWNCQCIRRSNTSCFIVIRCFAVLPVGWLWVHFLLLSLHRLNCFRPPLELWWVIISVQYHHYHPPCKTKLYVLYNKWSFQPWLSSSPLYGTNLLSIFHRLCKGADCCTYIWLHQTVEFEFH